MASYPLPTPCLTPNPAAERVTVDAATGILKVEVFNHAGKQVHSKACDVHTAATIDLRGWPIVRYVVSVETTAGSAYKVLTVAK